MVRVFMFVLLITSMTAGADEVLPLTEKSIRSFFANQQRSTRIEAFRAYPPRQQVQIFLFGNQVIHPPAKFLADCFALGGKDAVAAVRAKLEVAGSDLDTRDLSKLLLAIQESGTYNVRQDGPLLRQLALRISVMREDGWKDTAEQFFDRIVSDQSPSSSVEPRCSPASIRN
jgi:hypothetical protein